MTPAHAVVDVMRGFSSTAAYEEYVLGQVRSALESRLARLLEAGEALPAPDALADAMVAGIPTGVGVEAYAKTLGPFYSSAGVMALLGIPTKQALDDRRRRETLLAARTQDRLWVYPSFQFDPHERRVRESLTSVLRALRGAPRWGAALWLVTPHDDLDGRPPEQAADDPCLLDRVVRQARQYAEAVTA